MSELGGGHWRFLASALAAEEEKERNEKPPLCYARVSTKDKKDDLERQANALIAYCENKGWKPELIKDIGSGLNYKKRGLNKIIAETPDQFPFRIRSIAFITR